MENEVQALLSDLAADIFTMVASLSGLIPSAAFVAEAYSHLSWPSKDARRVLGEAVLLCRDLRSPSLPAFSLPLWSLGGFGSSGRLRWFNPEALVSKPVPPKGRGWRFYPFADRTFVSNGDAARVQATSTESTKGTLNRFKRTLERT